MADLRVTIYAAAADEGALIEALRGPVSGAIHIRGETVYGRDFSDASTAERVTGKLGRIAVEFACPAERLQVVVAAAGESRRSYPIRWLATEICAGGRLP